MRPLRPPERTPLCRTKPGPPRTRPGAASGYSSRGFERTVTFAPDEASGTIAQRVTV